MINPAIENDLKNMSLNDVNYADYIKENYIQIPDNATNGEMIKAMFPKAKIGIIKGLKSVNICIDGTVTTYELSWWNSPYKADKEGN